MGNTNFREHLIDIKLVRELIDNYEKKNYVAINSKRAVDRPDSREYIFPFEVLEDYFDFIKEEAKRCRYTNLQIVIKMGQYPDDRIVGPLQKPETKGYQTICFVPQYTETQDDVCVDGGLPGLNFGTLQPPY